MVALPFLLSIELRQGQKYLLGLAFCLSGRILMELGKVLPTVPNSMRMGLGDSI